MAKGNDCVMDDKELFMDYVRNPERYWYLPSMFHKRNIYKLGKALERYPSKKTAIEVVWEAVQERLENKHIIGCFVTSCGGSGSHFIGNVFADQSYFDMVNEVYAPSAFFGSASLIDAINLLHSPRFDGTNVNLVIINTAHLRTDVDLNALAREQFKIYGVIRNPFDVVRSLTFRKNNWRLLSSENVSDEQYLCSRISLVKKYYSNLKNIKELKVVRYEHVREAPYFYTKAFLIETIGHFCDTRLKDHVSKYDSRKGIPEQVLNFVSHDDALMRKEHSKIMRAELFDLACSWDYSIPAYCE